MTDSNDAANDLVAVFGPARSLPDPWTGPHRCSARFPSQPSWLKWRHQDTGVLGAGATGLHSTAKHTN